MAICRIFTSAADATAAVTALKQAGCAEERIRVVSGTVDKEILASIVAAGIAPRRATLYGDHIGHGATLVIVAAPFGGAARTIKILEQFGGSDPGAPLAIHEGKGSDPAAPLSFALQIPVLSSDPTPLSNFLRLSTLSSRQGGKTSLLGLPLLTRRGAPISSSLGLPTISRRAAPLSGLVGLPTLSGSAAPLSKLIGMKTLSKEAAPLSSALHMSVLSGD